MLVIESVIADEEADPRARTLDIVMLTVTGGRERTARQIGELFERAGLKPGGVTQTGGSMRIAEAAVV